MRIIVHGKRGSVELLRKALGAVPSLGMPGLAQRALKRLGSDIDELDKRLQQYLAWYRDGSLTRTRAEWIMKTDIRRFYRDAYVNGRSAAGNADPLNLTDFDERELRKLRYSQFRYLRGFLDDIDAGRGVMNYQKRMRMYADALSGPYWLGFVKGNRSNRRKITWVTTPAEHCATCLELDGKSWTPRAFLKWFGQHHILPGMNTECLCITTPSSRVTTARGLVPIADVRVGDLVLTHTGEWKPVIGVSVNSPGPHHRQAWIHGIDGQPVGCTTDHRWWTMEGWRDITSIDTQRLSVYAMGYGYTLHTLRKETQPPMHHWRLYGLQRCGATPLREVRTSNAIGSEGIHMQAMRQRLCLRDAEGLPGEGVHLLRQEPKGKGTMEGPATNVDDWYPFGWPPAATTMGRPAGRTLPTTGRRTVHGVLLDGSQLQALDLQVSMALDIDSRTNPQRYGGSPSKWRSHGRQSREPGVVDTGRTCASPHGPGPESQAHCWANTSGQEACLDMSELRGGVQCVQAQWWQRPQILFGGVPQRGTKLYDLTVADNHSFVIEGLVCHNSNCKCYLSERIN